MMSMKEREKLAARKSRCPVTRSECAAISGCSNASVVFADISDHAPADKISK